MQTELTGKVAIITGASRGIGRAIATRLASEGAQVVVSARDGQALDEAVDEIRSAGGTAAALTADLREPDAPSRLAAFTIERFGRIDIVVNNAGATRRGSFVSLTDEDWTDGFALKLFGAVRLTRAAWPHLVHTAGSVLFIAGVGGRTPGSQFTIGGSVNAALLSLTKALSEAGLPDRVRVNTINPGTIRTQRFQARLGNVAESEYVRRAGITHIGEPEDVAELAAFILGPRGTMLNGAIIDLDAGATKSI